MKGDFMWPFGGKTEERLKEAIKENAALKDQKIDVVVEKKKAVFSGSVSNDKLKNIMVMMAEGINGIDQADTSAVTIQADAPAVTVDEALAQQTSDMYKKITTSAELKNAPVEVVQKGDTVVVRGAVDSASAQEVAAKIAKETGLKVDVSGLQVVQQASKLNNTDDDGDIVYTVESGDSLSAIALHYYGSAGRADYMKIAEANGIDNPNLIQVGQKLKIPGTHASPTGSLT